MTRIFALENEGRFEGYVGNDPEFIENSKGTPQCFLHVGHTPRYKDEATGEWRRLRTVWVHFAVFGPRANFVVDNVRKGMRVEVKFKLVCRYHSHWKRITGFEAILVRPMHEEFKRKGEFSTFTDYWRPPKPKEGGGWCGDYAAMGLDALRAEVAKRGLTVEGSGANGRVLCGDMREALAEDDDRLDKDDKVA